MINCRNYKVSKVVVTHYEGLGGAWFNVQLGPSEQNTCTQTQSCKSVTVGVGEIKKDPLRGIFNHISTLHDVVRKPFYT